MSCVRPAMGRTSLSHKGRSMQVQSTKGPEFGRGLGWPRNQPVRPGIGAYKAKERPGPLRGAKNFLGPRPSQVLRTSLYGLARRASFNSLRARPTETKSLAFRQLIGLKASKSSRRLFLGSAPLLDLRRCSSKELAHRK